MSKWKSLVYWLEVIDKEAERLDWDKIRDAACEAYDAAQGMDDKEIFFGPARYLHHLAERLRKMDKPEDIGTVKVETNYNDERYVIFGNYSYKQFMWAVKNGHIERIDNKYISILESELPKGTIDKILEKEENEN